MIYSENIEQGENGQLSADRKDNIYDLLSETINNTGFDRVEQLETRTELFHEIIAATENAESRELNNDEIKIVFKAFLDKFIFVSQKPKDQRTLSSRSPERDTNNLYNIDLDFYNSKKYYI